MPDIDQNLNQPLGTDDSLPQNLNIWCFCFPFCAKSKAKEQPDFGEKYDGATDYLVEKLLITKAPLALFGTEEDFAEARGLLESGSEIILPSERDKWRAIPFKVPPIEARTTINKPSYYSMDLPRSDQAFFLGFGGKENPKPQLQPEHPAPLTHSKYHGTVTHMDILDSDHVGNRNNPDVILKGLSTDGHINQKSSQKMHEREIGSDFLNKYSSIFVNDFKDPVPKDPNPVNKSNIYMPKALIVPPNWSQNVVSTSKQLQNQNPIRIRLSSNSSEESHDDDEEEEDRIDPSKSTSTSGSSGTANSAGSKNYKQAIDVKRAQVPTHELPVGGNDSPKRKTKQALRWKIIIRHRKPSVGQTGTITETEHEK